MIRPLRMPKGITIIGIALFGTLSLAAQAVTKSTPGNTSSTLKNNSLEIQHLSIGNKVPGIVFENELT
jgi:hypothetical protein